MAAWQETETNFRQRVVADARIKDFFWTATPSKNTFDLNRHLRYVDAIFARVFK